MEKLFKKKPKTVSYENSNNTNNNNNNNSSKLANMNGPTIHKPAFDSKNGSDKKAHISAPVPPPTVPPKGGATEQTTVSKPQLIFHCQLAQGSQTGFITGFSSVKELYQKIAEYYEFPIEEILFCTLNSHKVDMTKLLGGQIGLDDFIFAHIKGRPKEIDIVKSEEALGLTITDNGAGYAFIKRIKEGSIIDRIGHIRIGDHIERLGDVNVVGKRHFEVARMLKEIPVGSTFTLRLVEPLAGFQGIDKRSGGGKGKTKSYGSGKETIRFKADGTASIEKEQDESAQTGIDAINSLLDLFMGINDSELASQIWDLGFNKTNSMDFAEAIDSSDLEAFGFTDDFIIELWGAVTDARQGRTKK